MSVECLSVGVLVADHLCAPIERPPAAGELVMTDHLLLNIGGCASNAAIDLVRQGVNVGVVGCVGRDIFGQFVIETLDAAGLDTSAISQLEGVGTSGTLIINVRGEDRRFVHTFGANAHFTAAHIPLDQVRTAKVLYIGGYLLMPALKADELAEVFRQARAWGVKTVLDVVLPGPGNHWEQLVPVLEHTDVFLPNDDEAQLITGLTDPVAQAERFRSAGAGTVVVTCGEQGTVLLSDKLRVRAGTFPTEYVGGTGAGDAFDAGFICGLLKDADPVECLRWGSALGASCVRSIAATESVFTRAEAEAFLREHELKVEAI